MSGSKERRRIARRRARTAPRKARPRVAPAPTAPPPFLISAASLLRKARRWFAGRSRTTPASAWRRLKADCSHAAFFVPAFYAAVVGLQVAGLGGWEGIRNAHDILPIWPVAWLKTNGSYIGWVEFFHFASVSSAVAALVFWRFRPVRALVFLSLFMEVALRNSFGKIGHGGHLFVLVSFLLVFLPHTCPDGRNRRLTDRAGAVSILRACRALILLTYSMSGISKTAYSVVQAWHGEVFAFAPQAMALHIADRLQQTNAAAHSTIGPWLIDHTWIAWPMMVGTIYMQFFAFWAAFRPSLQIPWALGLISFHIMSYFTLTINFPQNCLLLALLFLVHPPTLSLFHWRSFLRDLPLVGIPLRRLVARPTP